MSESGKDYGLLINKDIKLHRIYFRQMVKLLGINCQYRAPMSNKTYSLLGDLETDYYPPTTVGCIFQEHPDQKTMRKLGWAAELADSHAIIHVPYDTPLLQKGALFEIPSAIDNAKPRLFRVIGMQTIGIYPATVACELAPEFPDSDERTVVENYQNTNFNVLVDYEEDD